MITTEPPRRFFLSGWFAVALMVLSGLMVAQASGAKQSVFTPLFEQLRQDGFDKNTLSRYYTRSVAFETNSISRFFRHSEASLNYDQFLSAASIRKARAYMQKHAYWLDKAESRFNVDKEIITAILLVETRLGTFLGRESALNILSSMAVLADPAVRAMFWETIYEDTNMASNAFQAKAEKKSAWAYTELKALLKYSQRENLSNPAAIKSSYAGAIGIPQFMPSNVITLGVDADKNGRVDLFTHPDAIFSVANYLRRYGWKPGLSEEKAYKVLYYYNHSKYYVNTLLKISKQLKESA